MEMMAWDHLELAIELPHDPYSVFHVHLTLMSTSTMVFLTNNAPGESGTSVSAMGSFVYAMPVQNSSSQEIISTSLFSTSSSIDYATRASKVLARRMKMPIYFGCSLNLIGSSVEDEMESLSAVVNAIVSAWEKRKSSS